MVGGGLNGADGQAGGVGDTEEFLAMVTSQLGVSREKAAAALEDHKGDFVNAIMSLSIEDEEVDRASNENVAKSAPTPQKTAALNRPFVAKAGDAFKVILVGNAGVGKTNLLRVFRDENSFSSDSAPTLNPEFTHVHVEHPDPSISHSLGAVVWDTAGQERYAAVSKQHYRRADGALILFDASRPATFKRVEQWLELVKDGAGESLTHIYLVENKVDLLPQGNIKENERPDDFVALRELQDFCNSHGLKLMHTSAKHNREVGKWGGDSVSNVFRQLLTDIYNQRKNDSSRGQSRKENIDLNGCKPRAQKGCCQ
jgi:small GTP-binding protein